MSTDAPTSEARPTPVAVPLTTKQLAILLVKHYNLKEGDFDLMVEYKLGSGAVGPDKDHLLPGLMIGIAKVGLVPAENPGSMTINAAAVNGQTKSSEKIVKKKVAGG